MSCRKCPHHVRHGQAAADGKGIEFKSRCGLKMRAAEQVDCNHHPFKAHFEYTTCDNYLATFKTAGQRNDVMPTSDFQFQENLSGTSITEMELL